MVRDTLARFVISKSFVSCRTEMKSLVLPPPRFLPPPSSSPSLLPFPRTATSAANRQALDLHKHLLLPLHTKPPLLLRCAKSQTSRPNLHDDHYCDEDGIPIEHVKILAKFKSRHNYIRVLEVSRLAADHPLAGSRLLLLDRPGNIHSISFLFKILTRTYFDVFATFPPILPPGPIGILGFGAGSAARIILHLYPDAPLQVHGWELDPSVIAVGREFFGLSKLEREHRDKLFVYVGDALEAEVEGGFAGILVDLFAKGRVIPELQEAATWERLRARLRSGGRIMVNCGGRCVEAEDPTLDGNTVMEATVKAMAASAFADKVFVLSLGQERRRRNAAEEEDSWVALTGPMPELESWKRALPASALRRYVDMWAPFETLKNSNNKQAKQQQQY